MATRETVILPRKGLIDVHVVSGFVEKEPRQRWESLGFTILAENNDIDGVEVVLPLGWTYHPDAETDTAVLLDDQERGRAFISIPAKGKPSAILPFPRFSMDLHLAPTVDIVEPGEGDPPYHLWCYKVIDHALKPPLTVIYSSGAFEAADSHENRSHTAAKQACLQFLKTHWSRWESPFVYWKEADQASSYLIDIGG